MKIENEKERKICKETVKASNLEKHKKRIVNLFVQGQQREQIYRFEERQKFQNETQ